MEKVLKLYKYIDGVNDTPFPSEGEQVVTSSFRYDIKRMGGAPTISCTIMHELCLDKLWSDNVYASFNGEKFFIKQTPSSSYDNSDSRYKHEVELVSERIVLDNVYFYDVVDSDASYDKPVSNSSRFTFFGDVREFAGRLNQSLKYSKLGYSVVVDSEISSEAKQVSFEDQFFSNVLQEIYNTYNLPYYFSEKVIHIGYTSNAITQTFKYGQDESLLSINKQNANFKIVNRVTGVGSSDNIPYYYPNDYESKSEVEANGGTWINPQTNLMPPIYRKSLGDERFYSAKNNTYIDPISGLYYEFSNPYIEGKPKEHIINFEDIKPTIKEATNASGDRIDMFLEFAYDLNDNDETDEAGNYLHPYFFAKLKRFDGQFGFNLFEHSIDEQEMTISMTSGSCASCEWIIGVDEETQRNTVQVDDSGNLVRDKEGNVKFGSAQDRQNDTENHEVWIALKKDVDTFGIIMPNASNNYKPNAGDSFVILHIDLPKAYILDAEKRLEDSLVKYMAMNNDEKFNFSISFSRIYFAEHPDILEQLDENARLQIEYDNERYELYVSSYSYALNSGSPLPEVKVELSDTLTINQNALQNAIDAVKQDILSSFGGGDFLKQGLKYFLRKDVNDRSRGFVASDKGFEVGRYKEGELGSGGIFKLDKDKNSYLEVDKMLVRKIAYFVEIMIKKLSHVGGSIILSPASMKCSKVEEYETYYRCYFENEHEGKTINQEFVVGDQARSQEFNIKEGLSQNVSNQYYWRLVVGVGSNYIDLSKADCDSGSGVPLAGDDIVQLGNRNNAERQNAIILSSYGEGAPSFRQYKKIHSYSMSDAELVTEFSPESNLITGKFISKSGKDLEEEFLEAKVDWDKVLEQTDKEFSMWFFEYDPSPEVYPESEWFTDELRALHEQDLFYNTAKGLAWRYTLKDGVFFWDLVTDADTLKALEDAAKAQQTADGAVQRLDSIVSDGKLSSLEKKEVRKEWASIMDAYEWNMYSSERIGIDMQSQEVVGYSNAYNTLSTYITPLLAEDGDSDISPDEYRGYWTDYYTTETKLRNFLSEKAKEKADDVNDRVDDIVSDGVLSSLEKKEVLKEWQAVVVQYAFNKNYADKYELDYSDYTDAYHALGTYLNNGVAWNGSGTPLWIGTQIGVNTTLSSPTEYRKVWVDYYKAESILRERISDAGLGTRVQNFKTYPNELPVPPYNVGDRWMNAYYTVGGVTYAENDDMVCVRAKAKNEVASINDWEFSSGMNSDTKKDIEATIKNLGDRIELNVESIDALNKAYANLGIRIDGVAEEVAIYAQKTSDNETSIAELKVKTNSIEQSVSNTQGGVEEAKNLASAARSLAITASMTGMYSGEEYNQTTNPWQNWSSGTEYKHVGAIWYNPNTGVTKRYIGTDGTNSWETVDNNVYSSATFVFQNKNKWSVIAANFNDDGSVKGNSGIVTTSDYAALFSEQWSENESVRAEIGTFVTKNADGTLESNVKITADNIKLEGVTTINGSFSVDTDGTTHIGGFTVYDGKMTSDGDYKMTIDPVSNNPSISISFADHTYATMRVSNVSPYSGQLELYGAMGAISLLNGGFAKFENSSGAEGITIEGDSKLGPSLTIRKGSYYVSIGINSNNMAVIGSNCWPYYDDSTTRKQGTLSWDNSKYGKFK